MKSLSASPGQLILNGRLLLLLAFALLFTACLENRVYEKNQAIQDAVWPWGKTYDFQVQITDTLTPYNLYINTRHSARYPKSNLWIKVRTSYPSGQMLENRIELNIAEADGSWTGICSGDICFVSQLIGANKRMPESGTYLFSFEQDMRDSLLTELLDIGLKIERMDNYATEK